MEFEDQIRNINSVKFTEGSIKNAREYIKSGTETAQTPHWAIKYKDHIKLGKKPSIIFMYKRLVVPEEKRDTVLRNSILNKDSTIPFGIQSGYHIILKKYVGITFRVFWDFMNKQRPVRELDSRHPAPKPKGVTVTNINTIEIDLVEVTYKDLGMKPPKKSKSKPGPKGRKRKAKLLIPKRDDVKKPTTKKLESKKENEKAHFVIFSCVERVTGLTFLEYSKTKEIETISKLLKRSFAFYSKYLGLPISKLRYYSDRGTEFGYMSKKEDTIFYKNKVINHFVDKGAAIERRNRYLQKVFHRLLKLGRRQEYPAMVKQTMKIVNNTINKNHARTPIDLVKEIQSGQKHLVTDMINRYNGKRRQTTIQKRKLKPIDIGDKARLLLVKRSKDTPLGYKSYRGDQYTKHVFEILDRTKNAPYRYKIKLKGKYKWITRDSLLKTQDYDKKTDKFLAHIKSKEDREKFRKQLDAAQLEVERLEAVEREKHKGRRHKAHKAVYPIFIDKVTKKEYRVNSVKGLEKLRKKYDIPDERKKLFGKQKYILMTPR